jgi:hypothetical protein
MPKWLAYSLDKQNMHFQDFSRIILPILLATWESQNVCLNFEATGLKEGQLLPKFIKLEQNISFKKMIYYSVYLLINFVFTIVPSNFNPRLGFGFGNYIFIFISH